MNTGLRDSRVLVWLIWSLCVAVSCAPSGKAGPGDLVVDGPAIRVGDEVARLGDPLQRWKNMLGHPSRTVGAFEYDPKSVYQNWLNWGLQANLALTPDERSAVEQVVSIAHIYFGAHSGGLWVAERERPVFIGDLELKETQRYDDWFYWTSECILWRVRGRFEPNYRCETDEVIIELYTGKNGRPAMLTIRMPWARFVRLSRSLTPRPPKPKSSTPPKPIPHVDPYLPYQGPMPLR